MILYKFQNFKTRGKVICPLLLMLSYAFSVDSKPQVNTDDALTTKFEMMVDSAEYYSSIKRWNDAERLTIKALKLRPANKSNWLLWANLAEIRRNLDDNEGALEAYNIGLSLQPQSASMLSGRAELYIQKGEKEEALKDLDNLIHLNPDAETARIMRGWMRFENRNLKNAEEDFNYVITKFPDNPQGYNGLAAIKSSNHLNEEALKLYSKSLDLQPDETIYFYKTVLLIDIGKLTEASDTLREGMKKFPRNGNLYLLRAYMHKLNFQNEEAEIAIKLAKEYACDSNLLEKFFPKNGEKH